MKYLFVIGLGLLSFKSYCQEYFPGYIILTSGETTHGFIKLNSNARAYATCVFKKDSAAAPTTFSPYNLLAYGIDKNNFYRATEVIDKAVVKRVFAEVLVDGTVSLIKYRNSYLIQKRDSVRTFLLKKRTDSQSKNKLQRLSFNQLLQVFTSDCQSLIHQLKLIKFSEKSILTYLEQYHQCKNYEYTIFRDHLPWTVFAWWPFVGYHGSFLSSSDFYERGNLESASSFDPMIGISFQVKFPRTNKNVALFIDVMFSKAIYQSQTEFDGVGGAYAYEYLTLKEQTWKMPVGVSFPLHKSGLEMQGGHGFNFYKGDPKFTFENVYNGQVFTEHSTEKSKSGLTSSFFLGLHWPVKSSTFLLPLSLRVDHTPRFTFRESNLTAVYLTVGFKRFRE